LVARKNSPTISQEELYPPPDDPARDELDDARVLDLDVEQESPFLRGQKRVSVRRGSLPKKTATRLTWAALALVVVLLCGIAVGSLYHYGERSWRFRVQSSDDIEIAGLGNVSRSQVMEVMGGDIGRNIFFVPLTQRKTQLEQIPWVESASVMRFVPNRLKVEIHERTPVAFARVGSRILLVDSAGTLMELPGTGRKKYSFPVILGMNPGEPLSTRAPRMRIYNDLVSQLDSGGAHYSQELSEVDLSDPEDVKVTANNPQGEVLVHLGSSNYLDRYKIYVTHVQEWRQQFDKLESVDLRYDRQIIVNPDLHGAAKPAPLSLSATNAAMAAGVKPAALITHVGMGPRPVPPPSISTGAAAAKPVASHKPGKPLHHKPAVKKVDGKSKNANAPKTVAQVSAPPPAAAVAKPSPVQAPKPAADTGKTKKPSPAITKGQDHP
jgi:cell division protein FtsQ